MADQDDNNDAYVYVPVYMPDPEVITDIWANPGLELMTLRHKLREELRWLFSGHVHAAFAEWLNKTREASSRNGTRVAWDLMLETHLLSPLRAEGLTYLS